MTKEEFKEWVKKNINSQPKSKIELIRKEVAYNLLCTGKPYFNGKLANAFVKMVETSLDYYIYNLSQWN